MWVYFVFFFCVNAKSSSKEIVVKIQGNFSILDEDYHGVQEVDIPLSENPCYAPGQNAPQISNNNQLSTNSTASAEMHAPLPYRNFGGAAVHSVPPVPLLLAQTTRRVA